jgi:GNAT superfamily N-acetyltransferase
LAVDNNYKGKGLGSKSLVAAIREAVSLTTVGLNAVGIILNVLDNEALGFYQNMGFFNEFTNDPMRLFMTMNEAIKV